MKAELAVELPGSGTVVPRFKERTLGKGAPPLHPGWLPVLARVPLFASLPKRHLKHVAALAEMKRFKAGTDIVRAGTQGNAFFVILDGKASVTTRAGRTRTLEEGDYFGELALLDGAPRAATVTATNSLATAKISRAAFQRLLKEEPAIGVGLAHGLVAIIRDLQQEA
jgi:CRP-like cAMP-binding protein